MYWNHYGYFKPTVPHRVKGGIKAHSKRGGFAQSWWAQRWIAVLESVYVGARLARGRSYARKGQVVSIDIEKGKVSAVVQGSRPKPYKVTIEVKTLPESGWAKLIKILSRQAVFAAKLLSGEMPHDIEKVFDMAGLSLFPNTMKDLHTECSCPDWSNPCKHIAAVCYLLGEEFDRDPFLIFKLRGMSRQELVKVLGKTGKETQSNIVQPPEPLPLDISKFWGKEDMPEDLFGEVRIPSMPAVLPKRLGNFRFWRGETGFMETLEQIYKAASALGMDVFLPKT